MSIFLLIFGLFAFLGLVIVHEWGHFIAARKSGVEVEEFGIGFPPKAATIARKNGTEYTLNWLPLGGFVKLKGEHDDDKTKGSYGAASLKNKTKIMIAGVGMNLLTAFVLLTLGAVIGMPQLLDNQFHVANDSKVTRQDVYVGFVAKDSPAEKSGLHVQDKILAFSTVQCANKNTYCKSVHTKQDLIDATHSMADSEVGVQYIRDGSVKTTSAKLLSTAEVDASKNSDDPKGYLGIVPTDYTERRATWSAPIVALGTIKQFTVLTLKAIGSALGGLFTGNTAKASEQVSGPVGIFVVLKDGSILGFSFILMVIAIISLTLAIMNVLPIPALDGGRLFLTLLFRAMKKRLTPRIEDRIHGTGMAVLMLLFALITYVDFKRFF